MNDELRIWEVADREANRMTAEINRLTAENERMASILLQINDPNEMMDGLNQSLAWRIEYAMKHPQYRQGIK